MVTGDYYHTALAVARGVGMVHEASRVVVIQTHAERRGTSARLASSKSVLEAPAQIVTAQHRQIPRSVSFAVNAQVLEESADEEEDVRSLGGFTDSWAGSVKSQRQKLLSPDESGLSPTQSLLSPELAELSPAQSFASFSGRIPKKSWLSPAESLPSPDGLLQAPDGSVQKQTGNAREGLAFYPGQWGCV